MTLQTQLGLLVAKLGLFALLLVFVSDWILKQYLEHKTAVDDYLRRKTGCDSNKASQLLALVSGAGAFVFLLFALRRAVPKQIDNPDWKLWNPFTWRKPSHISTGPFPFDSFDNWLVYLVIAGCFAWMAVNLRKYATKNDGLSLANAKKTFFLAAMLLAILVAYHRLPPDVQRSIATLFLGPK